MKSIVLLTVSVVLSVSAVASSSSGASVCSFNKYSSLKELDLSNIGTRARIAAGEWVKYQARHSEILQAIKKLNQFEDDNLRELVGRSAIQGLESLETELSLANCIDRELSLEANQRREFEGVQFMVSDKEAAVPYIITKVIGASQVSIKTANLDYAYNLKTKKLFVFSSEKEKHTEVDNVTDRWISHIIQRHNL